MKRYVPFLLLVLSALAFFSSACYGGQTIIRPRRAPAPPVAPWNGVRLAGNIGASYIDFQFPDGSFDVTGTALTLSAWIKTEGAWADGWYLNKMGTGDGAYAMFLNLRKVAIGGDVGGGWAGWYTDAQLPADTNWHHIAITYDGAQWIGYADGSTSTPQAAAGSIIDVAKSAKGGWEDSWNSATFVGCIKEVCIWNRTLPGDEIQILYNGGVPLKGNIGSSPWNNKLKSRWPMDENGGTNIYAVGCSETGILYGCTWP